MRSTPETRTARCTCGATRSFLHVQLHVTQISIFLERTHIYILIYIGLRGHPEAWYPGTGTVAGSLASGIRHMVTRSTGRSEWLVHMLRWSMHPQKVSLKYRP
jgi:hypothetical protein